MTDTSNTSEPIEYMLTTVDNPFNPFDDFESWLAYDIHLGYNTPSYLARIARVSDELSEPDKVLAVQEAIDQIARENVLGMWRKVSRNDFI